MSLFGRILCLLAVTAPNLVKADGTLGGTSGCEPEAICTLGGSIHENAFSREPWIPYLTDDPIVRAADACLGYVVTRDAAVWLGGHVETITSHRMVVAIGDTGTRIELRDHRDEHYPDEGEFICELAGEPGQALNDHEFALWADLRLTARDGWQNDPSRMTEDIVRLRNPWIHATLKITRTAPGDAFRLLLHYFGQPVRFD